MAKGVNKVIIVGNLGGDPETKTFSDGGQVTNVTVATSESWKDKQTGQPQERTEWHRVVFNGKLAEIAAKYLKKGSKVYIEGSLRTRKWQDKQTGQDKYATEIAAREMQMLDSRSEGQAPQAAPQQGQQAQNWQAPAPQQNYHPRADGESRLADGSIEARPQAAPGGFDDFEDDSIPF